MAAYLIQVFIIIIIIIIFNRLVQIGSRYSPTAYTALHGSPMLDLDCGGPTSSIPEPSRVTWAAWPPGARQGTLAPGLAPGPGPGHPFPGMVHDFLCPFVMEDF